jgi:hypothetical protein
VADKTFPLAERPPGNSEGREFTAVPDTNSWSQRGDSNPGPAVYETAALPLSYVGHRSQC